MQEDRLIAFINAFDKGNVPFLEKIRLEAEGLPLIKRESGRFLASLAVLQRPERILEVGACVGYSALLLWHYSGRQARVDTIEVDPQRVEIARRNITEQGAGQYIQVWQGDAIELLPRMQGPYHLAFVDAAKGQYGQYLDRIYPLLARGGALVSDNIWQEGETLESRYAIGHRNRTIHGRMREYLGRLHREEDWQSIMIPLGDGLCLSVKK